MNNHLSTQPHQTFFNTTRHLLLVFIYLFFFEIMTELEGGPLVFLIRRPIRQLAFVTVCASEQFLKEEKSKTTQNKINVILP